MKHNPRTKSMLKTLFLDCFSSGQGQHGVARYAVASEVWATARHSIAEWSEYTEYKADIYARQGSFKSGNGSMPNTFGHIWGLHRIDSCLAFSMHFTPRHITSHPGHNAGQAPPRLHFCGSSRL